MSHSRSKRVHDEVWKLLPWYLNGTLTDAERALVEPHLADCSACQDELARCSEIDEAVVAPRENDWQPGEADLDRILERIMTNDAETSPRAGRKEVRSRLRDFWPSLPYPARFVLGVQALVIVGLAALLLSRADSLIPSDTDTTDPTRYETLTTPTREGPASDRATLRLQIVVSQEIRVAELHELIHAVGGSIVSGPTRRGVYELVVANPSSRADPVRVLESDPRVRFVTAIDPEDDE